MAEREFGGGVTHITSRPDRTTPSEHTPHATRHTLGISEQPLRIIQLHMGVGRTVLTAKGMEVMNINFPVKSKGLTIIFIIYLCA